MNLNTFSGIYGLLLYQCNRPYTEHNTIKNGLRAYHEGVSVGWQQSRPKPGSQSAHRAVVRMCGPDEVVHVTVPAGHTRGRSHCMAPQHMDGIVQTLKAILDTTLLWGEQCKKRWQNLLSSLSSPLLWVSLLILILIYSKLPRNCADYYWNPWVGQNKLILTSTEC